MAEFLETHKHIRPSGRKTLQNVFDCDQESRKCHSNSLRMKYSFSIEGK